MIIDFNAGQRPFTYTPPTGYSALNTYNLPDSTIKVGSKHIEASLYTGANATQMVTNAGGFQPDLVWVKIRSTTGNHVLSDSVRGVNSQLFTSLTASAATLSRWHTV